MTVYVIVQLKMTDRAAYDRYWCPLSEVRAPSPQHLVADFGKLWALANL
jgi:hypothetical protein